MILVAGATGYLGREICRRLIDQGEPVHGLVRATSDRTATRELESMGVDLVLGDLRDRGSLDRACKGAAAVISTANTIRSRQPGDSIEATDGEGQLDLVDAAHGAHVHRFIYVSHSEHIASDDPLTVAKRSVERRIRESGMTYTVARPTCFMEVWLSPALGFDYANGTATIYGSGEQPVSWISLADVAQFVVRALGDEQAENQTIELGGPEALSPLEVVRIFEQSSGRSFAVQHVPVEALRAQRDAATDSLQRTFATLMLGVAAGDDIPMQDTLRRYGLRFMPVSEYARHAMSSS